MSALRIVGISGNTHRPSRTRALVETAAAAVTAKREGAVEIYDLVDAGEGVGAFSRDKLPPGAVKILEAIEGADALIVGSPVYKGSYTGLFKHLIDFVDPLALAGRPVLILATGGGQRHALVVEHQLRPLFGFFAALTIPTAVYASDEDFKDGVLVNDTIVKRLEQAAIELTALAQPAVRQAALEAVA